MLNHNLPNINSIDNGSGARAVIAKLIGYVETYCGAEDKAAVVAFLTAASTRLGSPAP